MLEKKTNYITLLRSLKDSNKWNKYPLETAIDYAKEFGFDFITNFKFKKIFTFASPSTVRHVLTDNVDNYCKGTIFTQDIKPFLGNGLLTNVDPSWHKYRKIFQPPFQWRNLEKYEDIIVECVESRLAKYWEPIANSNEYIDISKEMSAITIDIISRILFGNNIINKIPIISNAVNIFQNPIGKVKFRHFFNISEKWTRPRNKEFKAAKHALDTLILEIISEKRQQNLTGEDLLSLFLRIQHDEPEANLTDQQLIDEINTLFIAGHETTANTLSFCLYLLSINPVIKKQLLKHYRHILQNKTPKFKHVQCLTYADQVIQESMRLFPPLYILQRRSLCEDSINDIIIPKNSMIIIHIFLLHRNTNQWYNPLAFDPDRFSDENKRKRDKYAYCPFGAGQRVCLGLGLAKIETQLILATIMQKYDLACPVNFRLKLLPRITLRPKNGIIMKLRNR